MEGVVRVSANRLEMECGDRDGTDWPEFGRQPCGTRFSRLPLSRIVVSRFVLFPVWKFAHASRCKPSQCKAMNFKTTILLLAAILVLMVGFLVFPKEGREKETEVLANSSPRKEAPASLSDTQGQAIGNNFLPPSQDNAMKEISTVAVQRKAAYETWIPYAARNSGVSLSDNELSALQNIYNEMMVERVTYENQIAKVKKISQDEVEIMIPEYKEKGELMKQKYEQNMVSVIGEKKATEVIEKMHFALNATNYYFGAQPQVVTAIYNPQTNGYSIIHSVLGGYTSHTVNEGYPSIYNYFKEKFPKEIK
jgi:hypothetical protein